MAIRKPAKTLPKRKLVFFMIFHRFNVEFCTFFGSIYMFLVCFSYPVPMSPMFPHVVLSKLFAIVMGYTFQSIFDSITSYTLCSMQLNFEVCLDTAQPVTSQLNTRQNKSTQSQIIHPLGSGAHPTTQTSWNKCWSRPTNSSVFETHPSSFLHAKEWALYSRGPCDATSVDSEARPNHRATMTLCLQLLHPNAPMSVHSRQRNAQHDSTKTGNPLIHPIATTENCWQYKTHERCAQRTTTVRTTALTHLWLGDTNWRYYELQVY